MFAAMPRRGSASVVAVVVLVALVIGAVILWIAAGDRDQPHPSPQPKPPQPVVKVEPTDPPAPVDASQLPAMPGSSELLVNAALLEEINKDDPTIDGWDTEAFHELTGKQFNVLKKILTEPAPVDADAFAELVTDEFASDPLRPTSLKKAFEDRALVVYRDDSQANVAERVTGVSGLATAANQLIAALGDTVNRRAAFKEIHVDPSGDHVLTTAKFQISGEHAAADGVGGVTQINAVWRLTWTKPVGPDELPRIAGIEVTDYEEVQPGRQGRLAFVDVAPAVLGGNDSYRAQLLLGYDHWRARTDRRLGFDLAGNQGLAVGDLNGDGLDDLYVLQSGGLPNRLYVHGADGTAKDTSEVAGVDYLDFSRSALFIDLDNDGDQDLILGMGPGFIVLENDGKGVFERRGSFLCPASVYALAAADYDNDGDVDLYVCGRYPQGAFSDETRVQGIPIPYNDANNGGPNSLWRNDGGFKFTDVTHEVGLDVNNRKFTLAAAWEDYDNDGDQDLYVANDFGRNNLYRNDGGKFVDAAAAEGVEDIGAGMSVSWGDANNDGWMDLYVGNMFSSAGHRVAFQPRFMAGADEKTRSEFRRHARGNSLFMNRAKGGDGSMFNDVTMPAGVSMGRWAWGSMFVDLNGDGREDFVVANGFITTEDTGDL